MICFEHYTGKGYEGGMDNVGSYPGSNTRTFGRIFPIDARRHNNSPKPYQASDQIKMRTGRHEPE